MAFNYYWRSIPAAAVYIHKLTIYAFRFHSTIWIFALLAQYILENHSEAIRMKNIAEKAILKYSIAFPEKLWYVGHISYYVRIKMKEDLLR